MCHSCPPGMKLKNDKSGCEHIECKDNEYLDVNTCIPCPFGTKVRTDKKGCEDIKCEDDQYLDIKGNCVYCPPGSKIRMDGKGCEPYFINCLSDEYIESRNF